MPEALDLLRQEHGNFVVLLRTLERQVTEFQDGKRPDYDLMRAILDYFQSFPDVCHHPREDLVFAKLRDRDPRIAESIGDLRRAHEELAARAREFSAGLRAVLEEAEMPREAFVRWARGFIDHQWQHINMEEATFFPAAENALTTKDWTDLKALMSKADDPLFGGRAGERFEQLRKTILQWQAEDETASDHAPRRKARE